MIIGQQHTRALREPAPELSGAITCGINSDAETSDTVKNNRCPARAQRRFFNIPCSRAYCTSSALVFTPRCSMIAYL